MEMQKSRDAAVPTHGHNKTMKNSNNPSSRGPFGMNSPIKALIKPRAYNLNRQRGAEL